MATDPLHGVTLQQIVTDLVEAYGFPTLAEKVPLHCFQNEPSISSSLKFLRRTPWARTKVESFYLFHLREQKRRARRDHSSDLRGAAGLVVEATQGVMGVVGEMHTAIGAVPIVTDMVYRAMRGITGLVGAGVDGAVAAIAPLLGESEPGPQREAVLAALNGVVGDHLEATGNPLAIRMALRPPLAALHCGGTLLVLVHGLSMNDLQWNRHGHDHGRCLARDMGFTAAYVHYNSGRHVSTNGKDLAALLEKESADFERIVIVGHSMGGLVARAAIHDAEMGAFEWRSKLTNLVTLGTPHHGAALERGGNIVEVILGVSKYSAPLRTLAKIRSAGVTDLRHGNVVDEDWQARDRFALGFDSRVPTPLPKGVRCHAVAGTNTPACEEGAAVPASALASDNLVAVASALGKHDNPALCLHFTDSFVAMGADHLDLLSRLDVYEALVKWLYGERLPV